MFFSRSVYFFKRVSHFVHKILKAFYCVKISYSYNIKFCSDNTMFNIK